MGVVHNSRVGAQVRPPSHITVGDTRVSEVDFQRMLRMEPFMNYPIHADPRIGDLWDAFAVAERLEK